MRKQRPIRKFLLRMFSLHFLLFAFLIPINIEAQLADSCNTDIELHSFSANILGSSSLLGITYERVLSKKFILEVGFGYVGIGTGVTFYPLEIKKSNICPYTGIKFSFLVLPEVIGAYGGYIPLGVTLFTKHRINIGVDIGPAFGKWVEGGGHPAEYDESSIYNRTHKIHVYGNLKVGFRY